MTIEAGTQVILRTSWMSRRDGQAHTVKKILPSGKIRLENGLLFRADGTRIERGWGMMRLQEAGRK